VDLKCVSCDRSWVYSQEIAIGCIRYIDRIVVVAGASIGGAVLPNGSCKLSTSAKALRCYQVSGLLRYWLCAIVRDDDARR
jgi:hypothetical protein